MKAAGVSATVMVGLLNVAGFAQTTLREELVVLSVHLNSRGLIYSGNSEAFVFFEGETPRMTVQVRNATQAPMSIGGPNRAWGDALGLSIRRPNQEVIPASAKARSVRKVNQSLDPGKSDGLVLELSTGEALRPGKYRVKIVLDAGALPAEARRRNNILEREAEFEVRGVDSEFALWDLYLFRAMRAEDDGDLSSARKWVESVLTAHPNSFFASWHLATLWLREGRCDRAESYLKRALNIIETKSDVLSKRGYSDLRRSVSSELGRCIGG